MYLPTSREEINKKGWKSPDIILVTGDSYIDSPYIGVSVIGHYLTHHGFKVAIIAQPDIHTDKDIKRLGEPSLFWGVTGGSVDSMVANYTASKKRRKSDDYTPGGINNRRPDRAVIKYANLIRQYFKKTSPIVLGGIEASLRRISHYDFWSNKIRKSILFDAKADILIYGMGEYTVLKLARHLQAKQEVTDIEGLAYISKEKKEGFIELYSHEEVFKDSFKFTKNFHVFFDNCDPLTANGLFQKQDSRYIIQNPPARSMKQNELDEIYTMDFMYDLHPFYQKFGKVKALDTISFSLQTHRGCYGDCNFCAISVHEGRTVISRSEKSILKQAELMTKLPGFKGYIFDAGGPTANMYGYECSKKTSKGICKNKKCLYPDTCKSLNPNHKSYMSLLQNLRKIKSIKKIFIGSGIRYDLILNDKNHGLTFLNELVNHHVSGQLKIAPEHTQQHVLSLMNKPGKKSLLKFKKEFDRINKKMGLNQFLTYYFISSHPGCTLTDMKDMKKIISDNLKTNPRQVQIFTPTPSTYSTLMYYTGKDPSSGKSIFVEKNQAGKDKQKQIMTGFKKPVHKNKYNKK